MLKFLLAAILVGTWNGRWFPSGRAEHRAAPAVEEATIVSAAKMLADGLAAVDPQGTNDVILTLNEIRNASVASNLIARIGRKNLSLASISAYRRRDRFDQQQDVIATTLPVADAGWSRWKARGKYTPPRGFVYAAVVLEPAVTAMVYGVHLKSNYRANDEATKYANRTKRAWAIRQILAGEKPYRGKFRRPVILAGDFNADKYKEEFAQEEIFTLLEEARFDNPLAHLPPARRGTYNGGRWGESALDYIMTRGVQCVRDPLVFRQEGLSDHYAVFALLSVP